MYGRRTCSELTGYYFTRAWFGGFRTCFLYVMLLQRRRGCEVRRMASVRQLSAEPCRAELNSESCATFHFIRCSVVYIAAQSMARDLGANPFTSTGPGCTDTAG